MPDTLEVELSRESPHSIEAGSSRFETAGDFDVLLRNHGASLHVHLRLEPELARAATIATTNHYVESETAQRVHVEVDENHLPAEGRLEVVTGYGAETERVSVAIEEPTEPEGVAVDERLGEPQPRRTEPLLDREALPLIVLGVLALLVAGLIGVVVGDLLVFVGIAVVLLGAVVAGAIARR